MLTYGIDEAGRGPILGPMVVALVCVTPEQGATLVDLGVWDSKRFGSGPKAEKKRAALAKSIKRVVSSFSYSVAPPSKIDEYTYQGRLNVLEQEMAASLLAGAKAAKDARIIADGANVFGPLQAQYTNLRAVNNGEAEHVAVAAASILAKVVRDMEMAAIIERYAIDYGPISGNGYVNPGTQRFLDEYRERNGCLPPEARASWGTRSAK